MKPVRTVFSGLGLLIAAWLAVVAGAYYFAHKPVAPALALALLHALWRLAAPLALLLLAGGLGRRIAGGLHLQPLAAMAVQGALGLGLLAVVQLAAGTLIGVSGLLAWILLLIPAVLLRRSIWDWSRGAADLGRLYRAGGRLGRLLAGLCGFGFALAGLTAAAPPVRFDALVYHLALPETYMASGRVGFVGDNLFWGMPQIGEMLYTWAMALTGAAESAALLGWLAGGLAVAAVLSFAAQRFGARAGWAAAAALLAGETTLASLGWAYVDWFSLLFGAALLALIDLAHDPPHNRGARAATLAGAAAGFAFGAKYSAGAAFLGGLAVLVVRRDLFSSPEHFRARARLAMAFSGGWAAAALPWLLKNLAATGNPLYPFLFPAGPATALRLDLYTRQPPWGGIENVVLLPWQATVAGVEGAPGFAASIGPALLAFAVLAGLGWRTRPEGEKQAVRTAALLAAAGLAVWAVAGRASGLLIQSRLYFVFFPAFALLAAAGFRSLERFDWPGVRLGRIAGVLLLTALTLNVVREAGEALQTGRVQTAFAQVAPEDYRTERLGMTSFALQAAAGLPESARILMLFEPRSLGCPLRCDPDEFLDRWKADLEAASREPGAVVAGWRAAGFTHVLYHRAGAEFFRLDPRFPVGDWMALEAALTRLDPVLDLDGIYVLFALP